VTDHEKVLSEAIMYASLGWHVVPLRKNGKAPVLGQNWQNRTSNDEDVVIEWFDGEFKGCNIGLVFGKKSNLIDIECDSPEAEEQFQKLFAGIEILTPTYVSKRGKHRLFQWCDELPWTHKAKHDHGEIEFRLGGGELGAQSVAPPSIADGVERNWILHPSEVELMEIPASIIAQLAAASIGVNGEEPEFEGRSDDEWDTLLTKKCSHGHRNTTATVLVGKLLREQAKLSQTMPWVQILSWNERCCDPPLPVRELRATFGSIYQREEERRREIALDQIKAGESNVQVADAACDWKLIRVQSDPHVYELESPYWPDRRLRDLTDDDLILYPKKIITKAFAQLMVLIPDVDQFPKLWSGTRKKSGARVQGIFEKIYPKMRVEEAPPEMRRDYVIAEAILDKLSEARELDEVQTNGYPTILKDDSSTWFKPSVLRKELQSLPDPLTQKELADFLKKHEIRTAQRRIGDRALRFRMLTKDELQRLDDYVNSLQRELEAEISTGG
jgi:hypothetical protein